MIGVLSNFSRLPEPAATNFPFNGRDSSNRILLSKPLSVYLFLTAGKVGNDRAWPCFVIIPLIFLFGVYQAFDWIRKIYKGHADANLASGLTFFFMAINAIYLLSIATLFSEADQNRNRDELSTFFAVWTALLISAFIRRRLTLPQPGNS